MKRAFEKIKAPLWLALALVLYCLLLRLLHITCPIKALTGISCPGCGMTRAMLSCLRLDFAAAFGYHPLFPAVVPALFLMYYFHIKENKRAYAITLGVSVALLVVTWLWRMLARAGDVVVFDPSSSWLAWLWRQLFA